MLCLDLPRVYALVSLRLITSSFGLSFRERPCAGIADGNSQRLTIQAGFKNIRACVCRSNPQTKARCLCVPEDRLLFPKFAFEVGYSLSRKICSCHQFSLSV